MSDLSFPIRLEANRQVAERIRRLLRARGIDAKVTKRRWLVEVRSDDVGRARDILTHEIEYDGPPPAGAS